MATTNSSNELVTAIAKVHASGDYSDLTIICGSRTFKVHKVVICSQSDVFAKHVKEGCFKEGITGEIIITESEPNVVASMIKYLYTQDFDDGRGNAKPVESPLSTPANPMLTNAKVYVIADIYNIPGLKTRAVAKFKEVMSGKCVTHEFIGSMEYLYANTLETDRLMRDVMCAEAATNSDALLGRAEFVHLCKSNGDLGFDVYKASRDVLKKASSASFCSPFKVMCPLHKTPNCVESVSPFSEYDYTCGTTGVYWKA